ncbi:hypothetical protein [Antribacter gilvus]|uniref:hypothetical protein n=1 Tax=Antribacter gilvus TaxID=2304675 RepID=UPI000F788D0F|nr:hypothetical protein [Antribacter gilvus]
MNRARAVVTVWALGHGVSVRQVASMVVLWFATALSCHVALPRIAPGIEQPSVDLQLFGIVALAATGGATSLLFHDGIAWLSSTAPGRLWIARAAWGCAVLAGTVVLALASVPFLPAGLPVDSAYLAVGAIWWSVSLTAVAAVGRLAGLLGPLVLAVVATTKVVPWQWNIVVHPDHGATRVAVAVSAVLAATALYALVGSASDRRSR